MTINILDAKNQLSQLVKQASAGEEVIIANRGVPVARLVGLREPPATYKVQATLTDWLEQNPLPAHARRSAEEIDASLRDERSAWD